MARVSGPLMSLDASGTVASTIVFSKWKGRNYVRKHVKPHNPKAALQVGMRAMFSFLSQAWASVISASQATWSDPADAKAISKFNAFMSANQYDWRNFQSPSQTATRDESLQANALTGFVVTPGVREVSVEITAGSSYSYDWGVLIYRSTENGFTPSLSTLVKVLPLSATTEGEATFEDGPLDAGTYYYVAQAFTIKGAKGELVSQESAIIE